MSTTQYETLFSVAEIASLKVRTKRLGHKLSIYQEILESDDDNTCMYLHSNISAYSYLFIYLFIYLFQSRLHTILYKIYAYSHSKRIIKRLFVHLKHESLK